MKITHTLITLLLLAMPFVASAYDFELNGVYYVYTDIHNKDVFVTYKDNNFNSYSVSTITIPESVFYDGTEHAVVGINQEAFRDCVSLQSIYIPDWITSIGTSAFQNCTNLTSVRFSPNANISNSSFQGCTSLKTIVIPEGVTHIGASFEDCTALTSITLPSTLTEMSGRAFRNCTSLKDVYITDIIAWLNASLPHGDSHPLFYAENFYVNGSLLTDLVVPSNVTEIKAHVFYGYKKLKSVVIPGSVTTVYDAAFEGCTSLTTAEINAEVITGKPFNNCTALESISIGSNVKRIGHSFNGCTNLKNVYITDIAAWCGIEFSGQDLTSDHSANPLVYAENLYLNGELVTDLVIPAGTPEVKNFAFINYQGLETVTLAGGTTTIGESAFDNCQNLTTVTIGEGLTDIKSAAFRNCTALTSISFPASLTTLVGGNIFNDCTSLNAIHIKDIAAWCNVDFNNNNPLELAKNLYLNDVLVTDLVIPDGVTTIKPRVFQYCQSITSVSLPEGLTTIKEQVFQHCKNIKSVTVPSSLTTTGTSAFEYCNAIKDVYISDLAAWCNTDFGIYGGKIFPESGGNLYLNNELVTDLVIPESITAIKRYAFWGCTSLTSITIPESVVSVESEAFLHAKSISIVDVKATMPPTNQWSNFSTTTYDNAKLIVPVECVDAYKAANGWNSFKNIEEYKEVYTLTLIADEEHGTVSGGGTYAKGEQVTITATPNEGYHFVQWSDGVTENPRTITVEQHTTLTAEFLLTTYDLTLDVNNATMGTVTGSGTYRENETVTIEAVANEGYHFVEWSDGNTENPRTLTMTEDMNLTARFILTTFELTLRANDETLGSVMGTSGTYKKNEETSVIAIPKGGVTFVEWSDGNTENPRTLTMTANMNLIALFTTPSNTVTATVNNAVLGTVSQSVVLTATPIYNGAYFSKWSDGNTENPRTIIPDEDMTITAEFILPTDLESVNGDAIGVTAQNREIIISGAAHDTPVAVYTTSGTQVYRGTDHRIALTNEGIYFVRIAGNTHKVVL